MIKYHKLQITNYKLLNTRGYTLIELLAASAIFAGMMIIAVATFSVASSHEGTTSSRRLVNQSARSGVETMLREMSVSRNQYNSSNQIDPGFGAYMIIDRNNNGINQSPIKGDDTGVDQKLPIGSGLKPTKGNGLIIFYNDKNNVRQTKAYYLCPHPDDSNFYSLGVEDLGLSGSEANFAKHANFGNTDGWKDIRNKLDKQNACGITWKQITSSDVIIEQLTDVSIEGYYPEQDLLVQPRLTVSVKARNRLGARQTDTFYSIYKTTTTHRDYASLTSP